MALWWPVDNPRVTGEWANSPAFYAQFGQQGHNGIDLGMGVGTPVHASDDGVVDFEGWGQNHSWMGQPAGICVLLRHGWGYTGYAHLSSTIINKGDSIKRGQLIGYSGSTGASTGPHLHWETLPANPNFRNGFAGRVNPHTYGVVARGTNPAPPAPAPASNQRVSGSEPVNRRLEPNTSKPPIDPQLAPNTVADFNGWIRGESVNGNNIWFRGAHSGNWFWSGGFTSQSTAGLQDLNPVTPPPAPPTPAPTNTGERTVGQNPANKRTKPSTSSAILGTVEPKTKVTFDGWAKGQAITDTVSSTDVWYHHAEGWWAWAGAFTSISKDGLKDMTPAPEPTPVPPTPTPEPPAPTPTRKPVSETTPNWNASAPVNNPVFPIPTAKPSAVVLPDIIVQRTAPVSLEGYTIGREDPKGPNHIVLHHAATTSLSGAINTLDGTNGAPTASYVVKDRELVEMVPEGSSPWTNTRWTSNMYSITFEMINESGSGSTWQPPSAETIETTAWAMARAAQRWNFELPLEYGVNVFGHRDVSKSATSCPGNLDMRAVVKRANEILTANPVKPAPEPTPQPSVDNVAIATSIDVITVELNKISKILKGEK